MGQVGACEEGEKVEMVDLSAGPEDTGNVGVLIAWLGRNAPRVLLARAANTASCVYTLCVSNKCFSVVDTILSFDGARSLFWNCSNYC